VDRQIAYLFSDSSWLYGCEYNPKFHAEKGKYHEVVFARGFSGKEITEMLKDYFDENAENIF
jgi:SOS response regulatory protein OraA/RecX